MHPFFTFVQAFQINENLGSNASFIMRKIRSDSECYLKLKKGLFYFTFELLCLSYRCFFKKFKKYLLNNLLQFFLYSCLSCSLAFLVHLRLYISHLILKALSLPPHTHIYMYNVISQHGVGALCCGFCMRNQHLRAVITPTGLEILGHWV